MDIRTYNPDTDYEAVAILLKDAQNYGGEFDEARDSAEKLALHPDSILVVEVNDEIVGTVTLFENGRAAWLYRFAVSASHETAVTAALFAEAKQRLNALRHTQVLVYAPSGQQKFVDRYEQLGFTKGADYTAFWRNT